VLATASLVCLTFTGCSSDRSNEWSAVYSMFSQSFGKPSSVSRQEAAAIPFATLGVRLGDGPEFILVLGVAERQKQLWTSASHVVLQTEGGRILRTAGLANNRSEMRLVRGIGGRPPIDGNVETVWEEDFPDQHLYSVVVTCHTTVRGPESVSNFGRAVATIRVDEDCRSDQIDWSFTNKYWISAQDGLTWRAIQYVHPKLDPIETEILRPAS
jgi:hypothetical protein